MIVLVRRMTTPIQNFKSYLPLQLSYAFFHLSSTATNIQKQSKIMCKMLQHERKRKWYDNTSSFIPSAKALNSRNTGKKSLRRVAVLNKLFMKNITDLLSVGGIAYEILGRGLEISKVNISNDFNAVNVYWVCRNEESDTNTETTLQKVAGALRHELSQLRVMGEVPKICFVKDLHEFQIIQLDKRLEKADFGEDYIPKESHALKSNFTLEMKLSPVEKDNIKKLENSLVTTEVEEMLPPMTHTVFNLDHQSIMNRLVAACSKSRKAWSGEINMSTQSVAANKTFQGVAQLSVHEQKQDLNDFLKKRQILMDKIHKDLNKCDSSKFIYEEDYGDEYYDDNLLEGYEFNDDIEEDTNELNDADPMFEK